MVFKSDDMFSRWIELRWVLFAAAVVLAGLCWEPARRLEFDQSIETMFAPGDPALVPWRKFKTLFGANEVLLAAYAEPEGLGPATFPRLRAFVADLQAAVPGMHVESLAGTPFGEGILDVDNPSATKLRSLMTGYLLSADRKTIAAICILPRADSDALAGAARSKAVDALNRVVAKYDSGTLAGEPVMLVEGFRLLEEDGRRLEWISTGLILLMLLLSFRSPRWMILPLVIVQFALLATRAILAQAGYRLTMVSSMLSAMLTIVGVATVVHLIVGYLERRRQGLSPGLALAETTHALFWPICGAIATDIVGFGALTLSHVGPVHDFGLMTACGSALILLCGALVVPAIVLGGANADYVTQLPRSADGRVSRTLSTLWRRVERHPRRWLTGIGLVGLIGFVGSERLRVETDFTRNFRGDSHVVRSYDYVETRLGGAGVWDVLVPVPTDLGLADLNRVRDLEARIRGLTIRDEQGNELPALTKVLGLVDLLDAVSPVDLAGQGDNFFTRGALSTALNVMQTQMPDSYAALEATETTPGGSQRWLRIMLRARERMPAEEKARIIAEVRTVAEQAFPIGTNSPGAQTTGFFVLLAGLIQSLMADQWLTFGTAAGGILLLLTFCFRSPVLAVIAVVPNVLAIFVMLGTIGWLGLRVNMGTVMIAAVSMGLSVDASIHFLVAYRRLRAQGIGVSDAIERVERGAGSALVWATLALVVGFAALTFSDFLPTVYFGALSSLTMIGGMFGNLVVLPLLVTEWERWRSANRGTRNAE